MESVLDGKINLSIEEYLQNRGLIEKKYSLSAWLETIQRLYVKKEEL